ncbi:hypothetical protein [Ideonella livida]|uniref:Uncharacterized protein n=1 Tax=Ideonella livida TaxID=2707176 RepID=A0A7C9TLX9_9BURK|nr:hypothetical protein [Ideonella livida]NDY93839.1 hypothetical protein [Ideonella livida]
MFKKTPLHALLCTAWATSSALSGSAHAAAGDPVLTVPDGQTMQIAQTTALSKLVLGAGASLTAPSGYSLTLTVDGVGRAPVAGRAYRGDVVLSVTENINVSYTSSGPGTAPQELQHVFRTGVYVNDGAYVPGKSVAAIVRQGTVGDQLADQVVIRSLEEKFNGLIVDGASTYTIRQPDIRLIGNGGNDFAGFGAAIVSKGTSNVTVDKARIYTKGVVRTAVFAGGSSTMTVKNSHIEAYGGTLPADYEWNVATGKMMEAPWMLGITGTNRATNLVGSATANYINSTIKAQAWGALSTDDTTKVRLNVRNSTVELVESGYGSYSIGDSLNTFSGTTFKVPDMALIMANGPASATFKDGSVVQSGRFGVMMHSNTGGVLTIQDSTFTTASTTIQCKSSSPSIVIDNATLVPGNGLLLQAVVNDDPYGASLGMPSSGSTVKAVVRNSTLTGDVVNGNTVAGSVSLTLRGSSLTGAVTEAVTTHATASDGTELTFDHPELYKLVGEYVHHYGATGKGMSVKLMESSTWVVAKTSYLSSLKLDASSSLRAPEGRTLTLTVNGKVTPVRAGQHYTGAIVLTVV